MLSLIALLYSAAFRVLILLLVIFLLFILDSLPTMLSFQKVTPDYFNYQCSGETCWAILFCEFWEDFLATKWVSPSPSFPHALPKSLLPMLRSRFGENAECI